MYTFLTWLNSYVHPRKTISNCSADLTQDDDDEDDDDQEGIFSRPNTPANSTESEGTASSRYAQFNV